MKKTVFAVGSALASGSVLTQGFDQSNLYVGGGLSMNSLSGFDDEMGYQAFVGYELDMIDLGPVQLAVEVGYFNSGKFSSNHAKVSLLSYRQPPLWGDLWNLTLLIFKVIQYCFSYSIFPLFRFNEEAS